MGNKLRRALGSSTALVLCLLCLILGTVPAQAEPITLPDSGTVTDLKRQALYLPDPKGNFSPDQLLASDEGFQPYDPEWEKEAPPLWIKLSFMAPPGQNTRYIFLVKRRFFERLDIYIASGPDQVDVYHTGTKHYSPTPVFAQSFVYPVQPAQDGTFQVLIHSQVIQERLAPLVLAVQDEGTFQRNQSTGYWSYGLYFGAMLALIFYNFVLYLNLLTPGHRWYVGAMLAVILFMGFDSGLLQGILPDLLRAREPLFYVLAAAIMPAATARFMQVFIGSAQFVPRLHQATSILAALLAILGVAALFAPMTAAAPLALSVQIVTAITWLFLPLVSLLAAVRGSSAAWIFLSAWTVFVIGTLFRSLLTLDVVPRIPATEFSLYIGSIIEAMILALGLSYRVGQLRTQRNRALREQHKAARLANIDPLTGAYNRRFIENYLDGLLSSDDRRAFQGSLIMLDLDEFKPVNDEFGHAAGDTVLQELAHRCLAVLRTEDVLARLGGDEFAIVLPDQTGDQALTVAERIRSDINARPVAHGMQLIPMSVSIGIVTSFEPGATAYSAFKYADKALYKAKRAGRNRVSLAVGGTEPPPDRHYKIEGDAGESE